MKQLKLSQQNRDAIRIANSKIETLNKQIQEIQIRVQNFEQKIDESTRRIQILNSQIDDIQKQIGAGLD